MVPCPCCGEKLVVIGSRHRKLSTAAGDQRLLIVRRLRCLQCRKIHHELPDCIVPYKRYESESVEQILFGTQSATSRYCPVQLTRYE
nr:MULTISPECIES: DUF6431 domain-containing protein [unclassified Cohnella]